MHSLGEDGFEFFGRAGEEDDDLAVQVAGGRGPEGVAPLAGGAAVAVGEELGAVDDLGLLFVVGRHGDAARGETFVERGDGVGVFVELDAERVGDAVAREVVFGGAEAAGGDDDVGARERDADGGGEVLAVVADDGLEGDGDAEVVEAFGEEEGVGVGAVRRQHLRADSDDFSDHVVGWMLAGCSDTCA